MTIPSAKTGAVRHQFVGSDVAGVSIAPTVHGGTPSAAIAFDVSSGSSLCVSSASGRTCTLQVTAPIGNDDFYVQTYDAAPVAGSIPSSAHVLGQASISNVTVAGSGTPSPINITVLGQVNSIAAVAGGQLTFSGNGHAQSSTLMVSGYDYGSVPVSGTYSNPITVTLTETGRTGHTQLTLNGSPSGTSATLHSSSDTLGIMYDGAGTSGYYAAVSLTAFGATSGSFNVVPLYITSTSPYYSATNGLRFTAANQSATLNISEAVGNSAYTVAASALAACRGGITVGSVSGSGATASVVVTSGSSAVNGCTLSVTDAAGGASSVGYTTTLTSGGLTIGGITEYTIPGSSLRLTSIVPGTDGNLYAVETIGNPIGTNHIDQISTSGALLNQFTIPTANANPNSLTVAPDGSIWFAEGGSIKIGRFIPSTTNFTEWQVPVFTSTLPQAMAAGSDGFMYFLDRGNHWVYQVTPYGTFTTETTLGGTSTPTPYAMTVGSDGNLYVADSANNQIAVVNVMSNPSYESIPTANSGVTNITGQMAGQIWFTEPNSNKIANVATGMGGIPVEYPLAAGDAPGGLTVGPDGNIWICAPGSNSILKFDVSSLQVTARYPIPTASASPYGITTGPDGRIWFTEFMTNKVGVLTP